MAEKQRKYNTQNLVAPWKPGQSGNPNGSRTYANRLKAAKEVGPECLNRIADVLFDGSTEELRELSVDPTLTPIERVFIGVVIAAFNKGDATALNILLDRFMGKVANKTEKVEVEISQAAGPGLDSLTREELEKRRAVLAQAAKKAEHE